MVHALFIIYKALHSTHFWPLHDLVIEEEQEEDEHSLFETSNVSHSDQELMEEDD